MISGNARPIIGQKEMYSVSFADENAHPHEHWLNPSGLLYETPLQADGTQWEVMVKTGTGWRKGGSAKEGQTVPYTFGQKSLMHREIKIIARQGEHTAELVVHPQRAKEPKLLKVELLDVNYRPLPKGKVPSYQDTVIARAYCVEMFNMQVAFTLWEDDARGPGHNPAVNALNKINLIPLLGIVNSRGIAEVVFRLPSYTMAVVIANARMAPGDRNEGAAHEYYVTADVVSRNIQKASPNVNVANPMHHPDPPLQSNMPERKAAHPPKVQPVPEKPKPHPGSPKFPVTTGGESRSDDREKLLHAGFVDAAGNRLHSSRVGSTAVMKITARNMNNKKVRVKVWEQDNLLRTHDLIYDSSWILTGDENYIRLQLTKKMFDKARDGGTDSSRQDYFIEVIHHDTSVTSEVLAVSLDAAPAKAEKARSVSVVDKPEQGKTGTTCICKE